MAGERRGRPQPCQSGICSQMSYLAVLVCNLLIPRLRRRERSRFTVRRRRRTRSSWTLVGRGMRRLLHSRVTRDIDLHGCCSKARSKPCSQTRFTCVTLCVCRCRASPNSPRWAAIWAQSIQNGCAAKGSSYHSSPSLFLEAVSHIPG